MRLRRILDEKDNGDVVERVRLPSLADAVHIERLLTDADARLLQLNATGPVGSLLEQIHDHVVDALTACSRLISAMGADGSDDQD